MARTKGTKAAKPKPNVVVQYLRDTRAELRKVRWPTRQDAWNLTKYVLLTTISMALILGLVDYLFSLELEGIVSRSGWAIGIAIVGAVAGVVALVITNWRRTS